MRKTYASAAGGEIGSIWIVSAPPRSARPPVHYFSCTRCATAANTTADVVVVVVRTPRSPRPCARRAACQPGALFGNLIPLANFTDMGSSNQSPRR
jgi:hypothetical protein